MKKRILSFILFISMVLCICTFTVHADENNAISTLKVSQNSGKIGDTVTVTVNLSGNATAMSIMAYPSYDNNVFELISSNWLISGFMIGNIDGNGGGVAVYSSATDMSGDIFQFTLKVKNNANIGSAVIGCEVVLHDPDISVSCGSSSFSVICEHTYGNWEKNDGLTHKHICTLCGNSETETHTWNNGETTTPASHVQEGVKTYTCIVCGETKTESIPKTTDHGFGSWEKHDETNHKHSCACGEVQYEAHKWNSGVITTAPTCKDSGIKTYSCIECGETKTEVVPATINHTWSEWKNDTAEIHKHICSVCGKIETSIHNWDSGKITTPASHVQEGVRTHTCTICGGTKTESIPKTTDHGFSTWEKHNATQHKHTCACGLVEYEDHKWNAGEVTKAPTCKDTGIKTYTCTVCKETREETIPTTDTHAWGDWKKQNETSHNHTCTICGKTETATHAWDSGKITTAPNCKDTGVKTYTCTACGETKTEIMPITNTHTWGKCEQVNDNQHNRICSVCGKTENVAHTWDSGVVTKRPTHFDNGERKVTCSACGFVRIEIILKLTEHNYDQYKKYDETRHKKICICGAEEYENHHWDDGVEITPATHVQEGIKSHTCKDCGETKTEIIPRLVEHSFGEWEKHNDEQHKRTCVCGEVEYDQHNWNSGEVTVASTCKDTGIKTYICTDCGASKTEIIPVTDDHSFGEWQSDSETEHKHICSVCGKEETEAHKFSDGKVCSVCGAVSTNGDSSSSTVELPQPENPPKSPNKNTVFIIVIATVAVICITIVIVIISKKKKK